MTRSLHLLSTASFALLGCMSSFSVFTAEESPAVVAQDLKKLRAQGKIAAVLWTRRTDSYTLQIVLGNESDGSRILRASIPKPEPASQLKIQAWLLKADGTSIAATKHWQRNFPVVTGCTRCNAPEWAYSFPLSASREAVAVAVMINGEYYIEPVESFPDRL